MDCSKKNTSDRSKSKKKMSKAQMQLAIIKKKECDSRAQTIVEKLLEPDVYPEWLLENLQYINKCHMEDVIEERSIVKICGYALCKKPITKVITQRYHISTKRNKVYDVSRRKSFCSSFCYGAANYLLEQMLTSPLWLREDERIPEFRLVPDTFKIDTPGEEVGINCENSIDKDEIKNELEEELVAKKKETIEKNNPKEEMKINEKLEKCSEETKSKINKCEELNKKSVIFQLPNDGDESLISYQSSEETKKRPLVITDSPIKDIIQRRDSDSLDKTMIQTSRKESKFQKEKKSMNKFSNDSQNTLGTLASLVKRIEEIFKEWITEETLRLLFGGETIKQKVFENITKQEKYETLCRKLNQLQLEKEENEYINVEKPASKSVPDYSLLQEEGNKLQLKVRAFYEGRTVLEIDEKTHENNKLEKDDDSNSVFPLTESQAPKAIRRKMFLDKINNILPDLLRALSGNGKVLPGGYIYSGERVTAVKALISTFNLTANNIVFKSAEWTLVGLIIIKMLSAMDPGLKYLFTTKQASLYTSMILMSYQLDSHYLDTFINNVTGETSCNINESTT